MKKYHLTEAELRLAELIWENAPLPSSVLVKLCYEALNWKKSTTYTMLKKLEAKGVLENRSGTVYALLSKEELAAKQSKQFVAQAFDGSLPKFLAAFTQNERLSKSEIEELQQLINRHKEGKA